MCAVSPTVAPASNLLLSMSLPGSVRRVACASTFAQQHLALQSKLHLSKVLTFTEPILILPSRPAVLTPRTSSYGSRWQSQTRATSSRNPDSKQPSSSKDNPSSASNPILADFLQKYPDADPSKQESIAQSQQQQAPPEITQGDLSQTSIFEDQERAETLERELAGDRVKPPKERVRNDERIVDPDPGARERWERKKVIQSIRLRGRFNRPQLLARTERVHSAKSHSIKTSVKKLGMLARQIAGRPLDEALVQMRFSRKKAAREVLKQLETVRDEAIVSRGMGLGLDANNRPRNKETSEDGEGSTTSSGPIEIQLKDGKRHTVTNLSNIYIDQAWVGRTKYGKLPDFRARGRTYLMRPPFTTLSLVLKEEVTRVRQWREREEKRQRLRAANVWTPLPDKPVSSKRQWYSW